MGRKCLPARASVFGRQASTCLKGSKARQDSPQVSVRNESCDRQEVSSCQTECWLSVRHYMVVHISSQEWSGDHAWHGSKGPAIEAFTDASGGMECGMWWSPHWMQLK